MLATRLMRKIWRTDSIVQNPKCQSRQNKGFTGLKWRPCSLFTRYHGDFSSQSSTDDGVFTFPTWSAHRTKMSGSVKPELRIKLVKPVNLLSKNRPQPQSEQSSWAGSSSPSGWEWSWLLAVKGVTHRAYIFLLFPMGNFMLDVPFNELLMWE